MNGRFRRSIAAALFAAFLPGATGLCEAAMAQAVEAVDCCPAPPGCPSHTPDSDGSVPQPAPQVPLCCAVSSSPAAPVLLEPTTTPGAIQVSAPVVLLDAPPTADVAAAARSSPILRRTVPTHLLFSVFLL